MAAVIPPRNVAHRLLGALRRRGAAPAQRWETAPGAWTTRSGDALADAALAAAASLRALGVGPGDRVGLVADAGPRWMEMDLAVLAIGAVDVPRGSDTTAVELARILGHAGVRTCLAVGEASLARVLAARAAGAAIPLVVRVDGPAEGDGVVGGDAFRAAGGAPLRDGDLPECDGAPPASLVYTSGTTGHPKGATLLHRNFSHLLDVLPDVIDLREDDMFLSMLPPWHVYERIVEYVAAATGAEVAFTDTRRLREHLPVVRPTWMASVPRVWEAVLLLSGWSRRRAADPAGAAAALRAALGGRFRTGVSGGGSLPLSVDRAYAEAGVRLLVGYGLTETAPVLTVRTPADNVSGTIGTPVPGTAIRLARRDGPGEAAPGEPGRILARGPQVMQGYWSEPALTAAVLDGEGWFDTGDLGSLDGGGRLVFRGRAKETIVLRGGENVEPSHVEGRLAESPFVDAVVAVGQDRKVLGALFVVRREAVDAAAAARRGAAAGPASAEEIRALLRGECDRLLTEDAGFAAHERVGPLAVIEEPFTVANGLLTATMKVRRAAVLERYASLVDALYEGDAAGGGVAAAPTP